MIDPDKLVSVGYGQWRPIASFDTDAERAKNRRVEIMITGMNPDSAGNQRGRVFYDTRRRSRVELIVKGFVMNV